MKFRSIVSYHRYDKIRSMSNANFLSRKISLSIHHFFLFLRCLDILWKDGQTWTSSTLYIFNNLFVSFFINGCSFINEHSTGYIVDLCPQFRWRKAMVYWMVEVVVVVVVNLHESYLRSNVLVDFVVVVVVVKKWKDTTKTQITLKAKILKCK